jgi:hypothetical protein
VLKVDRLHTIDSDCTIVSFAEKQFSSPVRTFLEQEAMNSKGLFFDLE